MAENCCFNLAMKRYFFVMCDECFNSRPSFNVCLTEKPSEKLDRDIPTYLAKKVKPGLDLPNPFFFWSTHFYLQHILT